MSTNQFTRLYTPPGSSPGVDEPNWGVDLQEEENLFPSPENTIISSASSNYSYSSSSSSSFAISVSFLALALAPPRLRHAVTGGGPQEWEARRKQGGRGVRVGKGNGNDEESHGRWGSWVGRRRGGGSWRGEGRKAGKKLHHSRRITLLQLQVSNGVERRRRVEQKRRGKGTTRTRRGRSQRERDRERERETECRVTESDRETERQRQRRETRQREREKGGERGGRGGVGGVGGVGVEGGGG
eukprot:768295-Hanusia_phi.AAC.3